MPPVWGYAEGMSSDGCTEVGCDNAFYAKGLCKKHYMVQYNKGRKEYYVQYREEHKEHDVQYRKERREQKAAYDEKYRQEHGDQVRAQARAHAAARSEEDKKRIAVRRAAWHEANRAEQLAKIASYKATFYAIEENWKKRASQQAAYARAHPELGRASSSRRRMRAKAGMTAQDRKESVEWRKLIADDPCFYCGAAGEHDDHYISLANGGTDHWWNLVRACAPCNFRKNRMDGDEFLALVA